jgi:hypothetical protein
MIKKLFLSCILISAPVVFPSALEVGIESTLSNLNFNSNRGPEETTFDPYYFPVGYSVYGHQRLDETLHFDFGISSDRILRNLIFGSFSYSGNYYSLAVGPYFGMFNTAETAIKPGIIAAVKLQIPGKLFFNVRSSRSLNLLNIFTGNEISGIISETGDYLQEDNELSLGFYVQNSICYFSIRSRLFSLKDADLGIVTDSITDYSFVTDIFQKGAPFSLLVAFTYRNLSKKFEEPEKAKHTIGSLILGTGMTFTFRRGYSLYANLESSIYSFGLDDLIGEFGSTDYLFSLTTGFRIDLDPYLKKNIE